MSGKKAPVGRTLGRLLLESLPALLIASLFTAWTYFSATDRESIAATDLVSRFGAAFFFVMWLVGQYLRVSKQIGIEGFLAEIREGVNHIRDALPTPTQAAEPTLSPSTGAIVATRALLTEAASTLEAGNPRAALMVAGAALEEAVREFARARGVAGWDRASPSALMRTIGGVLSPQGRQALHAMWDLRNRVVHGRIDESVAAQTASQVLEQIRELIELLRTTSNVVTGIPCPRCKHPTMGGGGAVNACGHCGFTPDEY